MVTIKNAQRAVPCDVKQLKADAHYLLKILDYEDFDLGIMLVSDTTIQQYNRDYRGKDKPTDVLSFPYHPDLKAGERIEATTEEDRNVGDLIIAPLYVQADAKRLKVPFERRMRRLLVHGICHVLGYDHETDADYAVMIKQERSLLQRLYAHDKRNKK